MSTSIADLKNGDDCPKDDNHHKDEEDEGMIHKLVVLHIIENTILLQSLQCWTSSSRTKN
jgi:hypothetical protein